MRGRQLEHELAAGRDPGLEAELAVHRPGQVARREQADPRSARRVVAPDERLEDPLAPFLRDPGPVVGDDEQDPATVATELTVAGASFSAAYAQVPSDGWERTGIRSNGSEFTVLTLGQYGLHDLRHHLWDVGVDSP